MRRGPRAAASGTRPCPGPAQWDELMALPLPAAPRAAAARAGPHHGPGEGEPSPPAAPLPLPLPLPSPGSASPSPPGSRLCPRGCAGPWPRSIRKIRRICSQGSGPRGWVGSGAASCGVGSVPRLQPGSWLVPSLAQPSQASSGTQGPCPTPHPQEPGSRTRIPQIHILHPSTQDSHSTPQRSTSCRDLHPEPQLQGSTAHTPVHVLHPTVNTQDLHPTFQSLGSYTSGSTLHTEQSTSCAPGMPIPHPRTQCPRPAPQLQHPGSTSHTPAPVPGVHVLHPIPAPTLPRVLGWPRWLCRGCARAVPGCARWECCGVCRELTKILSALFPPQSQGAAGQHVTRMQGHGWSPWMGTLTMDTCDRTCSKPARPQLCQGPAAPAGGGSAQSWEHRNEHWDIPGDCRWWLCSGEGQGGTHAGPSWPNMGRDEPWQVQSSPKSTQLQVPLPAALQEELGDTVSPQLPPSHVPRALAARAAHWGHCWTPAVPSSSPMAQGNPWGHWSKDLQHQHTHPSFPN